MGSSLNGQQIKNTYPGLIKTSGSGQIPASGFTPITDGVGNDSYLALSRQSVGVGFNLSTVDPSAVFEVNSTSKGVLLPRMTTTQRDAIATPANGLVVYNTTTDTIDFFDGAAWVQNNKVANNYISAQSLQDQTCIANNAGVATILEQTNFSNGISVDSDGVNLTQIRFSQYGIYNLEFSLQFANTNNQEKDIYVWLNKNGAVVDETGSLVSIPKSHGTGVDGHTIAAWNFFIEAAPGDQYQLMWATTDYTSVSMQYYPPTFCPAIPSAIVTVSQIS